MRSMDLQNLFNMKGKGPAFHNNVADAMHKAVLDGNLIEELVKATAFVEDKIKSMDWEHIGPLGMAVPILTWDDIQKKMREQDQTLTSSVTVLFSGSLSMLDLRARAEPLESLDLAKMKFACEKLLSPGDATQVVETVQIVAEELNKAGLHRLRRADGDEQIDSVI